MTSINLRRFVLAGASLLIAGLPGMAQTQSIAKIAATAAATGQPQVVVPANTVPAGYHRPHIWLSGQLSAAATPLAGASPAALPSFCNVASGSNYNFCPNALNTAYGTGSIVGANGGAGITIAIVDAFHYAGAAADFTTFNTVMGLPACTIGNGCFRQLNQVGGPPRTGSNSGWEVETMLDIEWAHAMAPNAKIVLVEGDDNSFDNLAIAVDTAAGLADIVSNSYGALEFSGESFYDSTYNVPQIILFSSGDAGSPTSYPCASPYVTCVGGTTLTVNASYQRTAETGWSGSGGGCSSQEPWQNYQVANGVTICGTGASGFRATPDVAATADPSHGVVVYDNGGYYRVGGTSVATPVTAGIYANVLAARVHYGKSKLGAFNGFLDSSLYNAFVRNYGYFYFDVLTGNNGLPAGPGYDLVTGLGVSKGAAMANPFFGLVY